MITTPYSLELTRDEDAKSATAGTVSDIVAGKLKIFIGANADPAKRQQYRGTLTNCFRNLMNERAKREITTNLVASGNWLNAKDGNITLATTTGGITANDVAVVASSSFDSAPGATHFYDETFNQLLEVLLENTKAN